jgi:cobalt/nickel transport system ATP-binding protein
MILEARDIRYAYPGGAPALDGASISVGHGEKLALLGPNGAGKSTLLLTLNGSLKPDSGTLLLSGQPVGSGRSAVRALRARVGLVMQDPDDQLFAATVAEDISFGPMNLGLSIDEARARVSEALIALGIETLAARPTHMLSFGQKKRVAIAGLIAMRPDVLLLDEPTAGLDPDSADAFCALIRSLHRELGLTVVMVTHDLDTLFELSTRVAVLADKHMIVHGAPKDVIAFPHPFIHDFFLGERGQRAMELLREYPFAV